MQWRRDSEFLNILNALQKRNLTQLNRDVAQRPMNGHPNRQESSVLGRDVISEIEQSFFEGKSISAFKYIVFNTSFQPFMLLDSNRSCYWIPTVSCSSTKNGFAYYPRTYVLR